LIIKPGWVSTNMTKKSVDYITASVEEESKAILNFIGYTHETYA
jgi:3-dehydroquinate dehydratase